MAEVGKPQIKEAAASAAIGVKERQGVLARSKKEEEAHKALGTRLRARAEGKGYDAELKSWSEGKTDPAKIHEGITEAVGGRKVSTKGEVRGEHKDTTTPDKVNKIKTAEEATRKLIETPIAEMEAAQKDQVVAAAKTALVDIPGGQVIIDSFGTDVDALNDFIFEGLRNIDETGEVRGTLLRRYQEVHSGDARNVTEAKQKAEREVADAQSKLARNKTDTEANTAALTTAQKQKETFNTGKANDVKLTAANKEVTDFLTTTVSPLASGRTPDQLEKIFTSKDTLQARVDNLKALVNNARSAKSPNLRTYETQLMQTLEDQNIALTFSADYDRVAGPRNQLQAQKNAADTQVSDLLARNGELAIEKTSLERSLHAGRAAIEKARLEGADDYVAEAENVVVDALKKLYGDRYAAALADEKIAIEAAIQSETDPAAKALAEMMRDGRWRKIETPKFSHLRKGKNLGHGEVEKIDKTQIKLDLHTLRTQGDAALVAAMLRQVKDKDGNLVYTDPAQIKEIVDSGRFQTEYIATVRTELVARAIQSGELTTKDKEFIIATFGQDKYDAAIERNKAFIETQKKRFGFVGKTKDFLEQHPQLVGAMVLTLALPVAGTLGWIGYGVYKLIPRGQHGDHRKKGEGSDHKEEEKEGHGAAPETEEEKKKHTEEDEATRLREEQERRARNKQAAGGGDEDAGEG